MATAAIPLVTLVLMVASSIPYFRDSIQWNSFTTCTETITVLSTGMDSNQIQHQLLLGMIFLGIEEGINPDVGIYENVRRHCRFHPAKRSDTEPQ